MRTHAAGRIVIIAHYAAGELAVPMGEGLPGITFRSGPVAEPMADILIVAADVAPQIEDQQGTAGVLPASVGKVFRGPFIPVAICIHPPGGEDRNA